MFTSHKGSDRAKENRKEEEVKTKMTETKDERSRRRREGVRNKSTEQRSIGRKRRKRRKEMVEVCL